MYGLVTIKGFYLPFAFLALDMLMGKSPILEIIGIVVGHTWYFFTNLLPRGTGQEYLKTPKFVKDLSIWMGLGSAPPPGRPGAPSGPPLFRAFGGRANRLS